MKLVSFRRGGAFKFGAVSGDGIIDLTTRLLGRYRNLREVLEPDGLEAAALAMAGQEPDFLLDRIELLAPVPRPGKIICVGVNYQTHRAETGREESAYPTLFTRFADTLVGHLGGIVRPKLSDKLDFEAELAVIIGKRGRNIAEADAFDHVAGYACFNDASVRDWQRHTSQFVPGKNFPATGGFGPWITTADEIDDIEACAITGRLNGEIMQEARIGDMIFPIEKLIAYISSFTPLSAGDVISTGTPGGVGARRDPQLFMKPGDKFSIDIENVGCLTNWIIAET